MHDIFRYDPLSGSVYWKEGQRFTGREAGSANKAGYIVISYKSKKIYAHRLAWYLTYGCWPDYVDHNNGDKTDNRIANLNNVSKPVNHQNMKKFSTNTSSVTGVSLLPNKVTWRATITVKRKQVHLGCFNTFDDAVNARKQAEILHGFNQNHGRKA